MRGGGLTVQGEEGDETERGGGSEKRKKMSSQVEIRQKKQDGKIEKKEKTNMTV